MKTGEAEVWLRKQLSTIYEAREAANIADMVMQHITGKARIDRLMYKDNPLPEENLLQLNHTCNRLLQHEPVQYVIGEAYFYGMQLYVDNAVLIPRPETEELVDWIVQDVQQNYLYTFEKIGARADKTNELRILDVGTGSGCIALALKKTLPLAEVWGCDVSDAALTTARRNGSVQDIRVDFVGLDFLNANQRQQLPVFNIIVSNPPYIPLQEKETMHTNVVAHEPHTALFVPNDDALLFYEAIANFALTNLHPNGYIYTEIHEDLGRNVSELFTTKGFKKVELKKDMQGKDRMVKACK